MSECLLTNRNSCTLISYNSYLPCILACLTWLEIIDSVGGRLVNLIIFSSEYNK